MVGTFLSLVLAAAGGLFFGRTAYQVIRYGKATTGVEFCDRAAQPALFWLGAGAFILMTCLCALRFVLSVMDLL